MNSPQDKESYQEGLEAAQSAKSTLAASTYASYAFHRLTYPERTPKEWAAIFGGKLTVVLERRFVAEKPWRNQP